MSVEKKRWTERKRAINERQTREAVKIIIK